MDCVTGSPMADTYVRQVVVIDDGVKCPRDTQLETASPGGLRGVVQKGLGVCVSRAGLVARDGEGWCGRAGDIATEPRTIDAIAALPAGHSDSGRVGEGAWEGTGPCPGGY